LVDIEEKETGISHNSKLVGIDVGVSLVVANSNGKRVMVSKIYLTVGYTATMLL